MTPRGQFADAQERGLSQFLWHGCQKNGTVPFGRAIDTKIRTGPKSVRDGGQTRGRRFPTGVRVYTAAAVGKPRRKPSADLGFGIGWHTQQGVRAVRARRGSTPPSGLAAAEPRGLATPQLQ